MGADYLEIASLGCDVVNYGLIEYLSSEEAGVKDILLLAARYPFVTGDMIGYGVNVGESLRKALSHIEEMEDLREAYPFLPILRLYVALENNWTSVLIIAEQVEELADWVYEEWKRTHESVFLPEMIFDDSFPEDREWGLIGIVLPGWVLLFDEDAEYSQQEELDGGIHVAYLALKDEDIRIFDPHIELEDSSCLLLEIMLKKLPSKRLKNHDVDKGR